MNLKNCIVSFCTLIGIFSLGACSQKTSSNGVCTAAGLYDTQSNCLSSNGSSTCAMANIQVEGQNLICWQKSTSSNNTENSGNNNNNNTNNNTYDPCAPGNPPPTWATTAWTPSSCSPGVTSLKRQVYCPTTQCNCEGEAPPKEQSCTGDLYGNAHYSSECTSASGTPVTKDGQKACLFYKSSCPSGWSAHKGSNEVQYTTTEMTSYVDVLGCFGYKITKLTGSHDLAPTPVESAEYCTERNFWCTGCKTKATAYSTVKAVLCH